MTPNSQPNPELTKIQKELKKKVTRSALNDDCFWGDEIDKAFEEIQALFADHDCNKCCLKHIEEVSKLNKQNADLKKEIERLRDKIKLIRKRNKIKQIKAFK